MKITVLTLCALFSLVNYTNAQDSDYLIVEVFKEDINIFKYKIDNAISSKQLKYVQNELNNFKIKNNDKKKVLNRALYPSTVESIIDELNTTLFNNESKLLLIEFQRDQLFKLTNTINAQKDEITRLFTLTDSLNTQIFKMNLNDQKSSELITTYRNLLKKRDQLMFKFIGSLIIVQKKYSIDENSVVESHTFLNTKSLNPLELIQSVLDEYLKPMNYTNSVLLVEEHIRINSLQKKFEEVWSIIGDELIYVYGGSQKNKLVQSINRSIQEWSRVSSKRMWDSIEQYVTNSNIDLNDFDDKHSFFISLQTFITNGRLLSEKEVFTNTYFSKYERISEFWNFTFKNKWNLISYNQNIIDNNKIDKIDEALIQWEQVSRPFQPLFISVLSIMFVSLMGFVLVLFKTMPRPE